MKIAVHQPNFLPYLGFFDKARLVDIFVILDDVQYTKGGFTNRNKIKKPNGTLWLTVPIKGDKMVPISEILIADHLSWRDQHLKTLKHMYGKAEHYDAISPQIEQIYQRDWKFLFKFNLALQKASFEMLGIDTEIRFSSELNVSAEDGSDRILEICQKLGSDHYFSGETGRKYLDISSYNDAGIDVSYHEFEHPTYTQLFGEFIPNLSVIDYLMNVGPVRFW